MRMCSVWKQRRSQPLLWMYCWNVAKWFWWAWRVKLIGRPVRDNQLGQPIFQLDLSHGGLSFTGHASVTPLDAWDSWDLDLVTVGVFERSRSRVKLQVMTVHSRQRQQINFHGINMRTQEQKQTSCGTWGCFLPFCIDANLNSFQAKTLWWHWRSRRLCPPRRTDFDGLDWNPPANSVEILMNLSFAARDLLYLNFSATLRKCGPWPAAFQEPQSSHIVSTKTFTSHSFFCFPCWFGWCDTTAIEPGA